MSDSNTLSVSWLICELRLLDRLLYKQRNQHHKGNYFHKLVAVKHHTRQVLQLTQAYQHQAKQTNATSSTAASTPPRSPSLSQLKFSEDAFQSIVADRRTMQLQSRQEIAKQLVRCQHAIIKASAVLYALLSQTYFMSFALTALAIIARMYSSQRAFLAQLLDACAAQVRSKQLARKQKNKQRPSDSTVDNSSNASSLDPSHMLADSLLRAMRSDSEREWIERCDGAQLFLPLNKLPCASAARAACLQLQLGPQATSSNDPQSVSRLLAHSKQANSANDDEGDSDEDEDMDEVNDDDEENETAAVSTPKNPSKSAALPSALSFFSPAASLKQSAAPAAKTKTSTPAASSATAFQTPAKTVNTSKIVQKMELEDEDDDGDEEEEAADERESDDENENGSEEESANDNEEDDSGENSDEEDDDEEIEAKPHSATAANQKSLPSAKSKQSFNPAALKNIAAQQKQVSLTSTAMAKSIGQKRKDAPATTTSGNFSTPTTAQPSAQQQNKPQPQQMQQPPLKKAKLSPAVSSPALTKKLPSPSPQPSLQMKDKPSFSSLNNSAAKQAPTLNPLSVLTGASQKKKPLVASSGPPGLSKQLSKQKKTSKSEIDEMDDIFG